MIHVGFNNYVQKDKIISVANTQKHVPSPIRRALHHAQNEGKDINLTAGRRTKSVIFTVSGHVILCALESRTIIQRIRDGVKE